MEDIITNPEMNEKIIGLLILAEDNYCLYAAKRIMELEEEVRKLKAESVKF